MGTENLTNTQTVDVIGVFDSNSQQLFPLARPIKASVQEVYKIMEHPIESGSQVGDHKIRLQVEIEIPLIIAGNEYADTYKSIKSAAASNTLYTVMTRTGAYPNMTVQAFPHEEGSDMMDGITMALKMKEVILVQAQYQALPPRKVANQKDASVLDRGEQNTQTSSVAYRLFYGSSGTPK